MTSTRHRPPTAATGTGRWTLSRIALTALPAVFVLIWSSGYLAGSLGVRSGSSLGLVAWRFLIAFGVLTAVAVLTGAPWPRRPAVYAHLLITGTLLQTVQLGFVYLGLGHGVPAGLSSVVLSTSPLIVSAAAVPLFSERLSGRQWIGLALGLAGVVITLSEKLTGAGQSLTGYGFTTIALVGFAGGTLYQKRFGSTVDLRSGTAVQLLGATVTVFPMALLHGGLGIPLTGEALGALAWLAIVNSIGAITLLFILLRRRSGGAATSLLYLVPPVTALLAVPILGQDVTATVFIGMAVSGIGVLLVLTRAREQPALVPGGSGTCSG